MKTPHINRPLRAARFRFLFPQFLLTLACLQLAVSSASAQGLFPAPSDFNASWVWPGVTPPAKIKLTWQEPPGTGANTIYLIHRRYGSTAVASGWTIIHNGTVSNEPGSTTLRTITDHTLAPQTAFRYLHYRIRAMSGTATTAVPTSGAAETAINGNPAEPSGGLSFDSDADGIPDTIELTYSSGSNPLRRLDWADGSGDADGDGIPNAWEFALSGGEAIHDHQITPSAHCTVDRNQAIQTAGAQRNYHTITAAIAGLPAISAAHPTRFRIIRVAPGFYEENLTISTSLEVALIATRSPLNVTVSGQTYPLFDPTGHFEIRGTHASSPVLSITDSHAVIDGFIISRRPGTTGPVVSISQNNTPVERFYISRLVNCLFRNNNIGTESVIHQNQCRLILSHCTFYMNAAANQALGTALSCGKPSDSFLNSTAQTRVHNSIFWNPVNTTIPEYQAEGPIQFISSLVHQRRGPEGYLQSPVAGIFPTGIDPYLTPLGYLAGPPPPPTSIPPAPPHPPPYGVSHPQSPRAP